MAPPNRWALTKRSLEKPAQMRLIRKTDAQSYLAERFWGCHHQMTGSLEAPLDHVSMRRFSEGLFERTREVRPASLRYSTEIPGADIAV
jgi:hypothetical protein